MNGLTKDLGLVVCMRNNQGNEFSLMAVLDPIIMVVIIFQYLIYFCCGEPGCRVDGVVYYLSIP